MGAMNWLPMQQPMNPIEAAQAGSGIVGNIFDAMDRVKSSAIQRALALQELQNQAALAPLQQQALALQNAGVTTKNQYIAPEAQADINLKNTHGGYFDALGNYKATIAPSISDKNETAANFNAVKQALGQQQVDQNDVMNPIKAQNAAVQSAALPGQIQSNLDLVNARMNDLGVHTHNQQLIGPILAQHMDAGTAQLHAKANEDDAHTAVLTKILNGTGDNKDALAPQNVAPHWDMSTPEGRASFIKYTQMYTSAKLDPTGMKAMADTSGAFSQGIQDAGGSLGTGIINERMKSQASDQQQQQIRAGLMQLLSGGQQQPPGQVPQGAPPPPGMPPQGAVPMPPAPMPPAAPPTAAPPQQAAPPAAPRFAEGQVIVSPSTGRMFKIVNGQPVELPPNASASPTN